jgi:hypothetical protein
LCQTEFHAFNDLVLRRARKKTQHNTSHLTESAGTESTFPASIIVTP